MTDDEKGRLFFRMKEERDHAKDELCLARKKAEILKQRLYAARLALGHEADWKPDDYPSVDEITDTLGTMERCQKAIRDYDEFVK